MPSGEVGQRARRFFDTAEDFLRALDPLLAEWQTEGGWMFRGHADARWGLVPGVLRNEAWRTTLSRDQRELVERPEHRAFIQVLSEFFRVHAFAFAAERAGLHVPADLSWLRDYKLTPETAGEWPREEILPLMALAQHSGVATRLLDWTRRSRVAAYFAASGNVRSEEGSIDALCVWALRRDSVLRNRNTFVIETAHSTNANLHAQDGLFSVVRGADAPADLRDSMTECNDPGMQELVLPSSEAPKLLRLLAYEHVTAASIYPNYSGVARALDDEMWWDRPGATASRELDWADGPLRTRAPGAAE